MPVYGAADLYYGWFVLRAGRQFTADLDHLPAFDLANLLSLAFCHTFCEFSAP